MAAAKCSSKPLSKFLSATASLVLAALSLAASWGHAPSARAAVRVGRLVSPPAAAPAAADVYRAKRHSRLAVVAASAARPRWYQVQRGDTLSSIAARYFGLARRWEGLYAANHHAVGRDPNALRRGMVLRLANYGVTAPMARHIARALAPPPPPPPPAAPVVSVAQVAAAPAHPEQQPAPVASPVTYSGYGGFQSCVIAAESGGNPQVMNATGHWGLYQFSASTWAAYGGNPADFGSGSAAEQNQVFANAMSTPGGAQNWSPYDGC